VITVSKGVLPHLLGLRRPTDPARIRRLIAVVVGIAAIGLVPWMVYLGVTLPRRYEARHWSLLWIGFDVIECLVLAFCAWSTWRRRQLMPVTAVIAGTLVFSDAWFDVITSWGNRDSWFTLVLAVFVELPFAAFMFWIAYRAIRRSSATYDGRVDRTNRPGYVHRAHDLSLPRGETSGSDPCQTGVSSQSLEGVRSIASELHDALDGLSLISNDSIFDRRGIDRARSAIERALDEIDVEQSAMMGCRPPIRNLRERGLVPVTIEDDGARQGHRALS
jgi:hypothetical protein